ncbi:MAG TPA: ABC transporter permease subunit [Chthonomonadales bacterium]|nr:ABC transporter permease subunit [Chthonomonadales bacterium]
MAIRTVAAKLAPDNPVLIRELRARMRGARAYWILTGFVLLLCAGLVISYAVWYGERQHQTVVSTELPGIGALVLQGILLAEIFLMLFISPALTAGSITSESEQQTLDMLRVTPMRSRSIVGGKLTAAVTFCFLLLLAALPITFACFVFGGIDPQMVGRYYMLLASAGLLAAAVGLMWSAIARSTTQAVMLTYGTICAGLIALLALAVIGAISRFNGEPSFSSMQTILSALFDDRLLGFEVVPWIGMAAILAAAAVPAFTIASHVLAGKNAIFTAWPAITFFFTMTVAQLYTTAVTLWLHPVSLGLQIVAGPPFHALAPAAALVLGMAPTFVAFTYDGDSPASRRLLRQIALEIVQPVGLCTLAFVLFAIVMAIDRQGFSLHTGLLQALAATVVSTGGICMMAGLVKQASSNGVSAWIIAETILVMIALRPAFSWWHGAQVWIRSLNPVQYISGVAAAEADNRGGAHFAAVSGWQVTAAAWALIGLACAAIRWRLVRKAKPPAGPGHYAPV